MAKLHNKIIGNFVFAEEKKFSLSGVFVVARGGRIHVCFTA